ncbi:MAG: hypothetical protein HFJ33_04720 [Clostridia bacterium]|nr:hypothetical protein [Clostridia bacterium]
MKKENIRKNIIYGVIAIAMIGVIIIIMNIASSNSKNLENHEQTNTEPKQVEDILPEAPPETKNPTNIEEMGMEGEEVK